MCVVCGQPVHHGACVHAVEPSPGDRVVVSSMSVTCSQHSDCQCGNLKCRVAANAVTWVASDVRLSHGHHRDGQDASGRLGRHGHAAGGSNPRGATVM